MKPTINFLRAYLKARPIFLSVLRSKEAALYQQHVPLGHRVLDVGCGDGFFARVTFGKANIDMGLDMENSRIGEAVASGAYKKIVSYDGKIFPFQNQMFRTIVINSVLEHVEDLTSLLRESHRVMARGGTCYVTVMAAPWETHLFGAKLFGDMYRRWMKKKQVHVNLFTYAEWEKSFLRAGFRIQSVTPYLSPRAAMWLDILHYLSIPSLISYSMNRRWVWWPSFTRYYPVKLLARLMDEPVGLQDAGALFFVLRR